MLYHDITSTQRYILYRLRNIVGTVYSRKKENVDLRKSWERRSSSKSIQSVLHLRAFDLRGNQSTRTFWRGRWTSFTRGDTKNLRVLPGDSMYTRAGHNERAARPKIYACFPGDSMYTRAGHNERAARPATHRFPPLGVSVEITLYSTVLYPITYNISYYVHITWFSLQQGNFGGSKVVKGEKRGTFQTAVYQNGVL